MTSADLGFRTRSQSLAAARQARFDKWFKDRKWRVATERTGESRDGDVVVTYDHGEFLVAEPGEFQTPLGNRGRHGFLIQEVDPATGTDIEGSLAAFGLATLRNAAREHGSCEVPEARLRG
jgi:hypothetical protein